MTSIGLVFTHRFRQSIQIVLLTVTLQISENCGASFKKHMGILCLVERSGTHWAIWHTMHTGHARKKYQRNHYKSREYFHVRCL